MQDMGPVIILMGVSGCGKTTVGQNLAEQLGWPFYDADDYHPPQNVAKMVIGIPLQDEDRWPWLARLRQLIETQLTHGRACVMACSALRRPYRDYLRAGDKRVLFFYLQADFDTIWARMQARQGHYMGAGMLQSQFDTLEPPTSQEAITINGTGTVHEIAAAILEVLKAARPSV
jgi:gluconokinase